VSEDDANHPVVPGAEVYVPAADPKLEVFRSKPGVVGTPTETTPVALVSTEAKTEPVDDGSGVIADEKQYRPAIDPKLEVFRSKPTDEKPV
jgi:hypothetical protein